MGKIEKNRGTENAKPTKLERGIFRNEEAIDKAEEFLKTKYQISHGSQSKESHGLPSLHSPLILHDPKELLQLIKDPGKPFYIGGIYNQTVSAGDLVPAVDGYRLILSAYSYQVIFSQNKNFYAQTGQGFTSDVIYAPISRAGKKAQRLIALELKIIMGIIAGSNLVGFFLVIGEEAIELIYEHREDFKKWAPLIFRIMGIATLIRTYIPTLYHKVFKLVLQKVSKDVFNKIPESIKVEHVYFAVGVIIGETGTKGLQGKFSFAGLILVVIKQIVTRFALNVTPEAFIKNIKEYENHIMLSIMSLKDSEIVLTKDEAKQIAIEMQNHPSEVKIIYNALAESK